MTDPLSFIQCHMIHVADPSASPVVMNKTLVTNNRTSPPQKHAKTPVTTIHEQSTQNSSHSVCDYRCRVAAIAVVAITAILFLAFLAFILYRRRKLKKQAQQSHRDSGMLFNVEEARKFSSSTIQSDLFPPQPFPIYTAESYDTVRYPGLESLPPPPRPAAVHGPVQHVAKKESTPSPRVSFVIQKLDQTMLQLKSHTTPPPI